MQCHEKYWIFKNSLHIFARITIKIISINLDNTRLIILIALDIILTRAFVSFAIDFIHKDTNTPSVFLHSIVNQHWNLSSTSSSTWKQRIYYFTFPADTLNETPGGSRGKKGEKNSVVLHLPRAISSHLYVYLGLVSVHGLTMIFLNVQVYNGYYHIARRCTER